MGRILGNVPICVSLPSHTNPIALPVFQDERLSGPRESRIKIFRQLVKFVLLSVLHLLRLRESREIILVRKGVHREDNCFEWQMEQLIVRASLRQLRHAGRSCGRPVSSRLIWILASKPRGQIDKNRVATQPADLLCSFDQKIALAEAIIPGDVSNTGRKLR